MKPTKQMIENEPAGPRIDAWFAELIGGWKEKLWMHDDECSESNLPPVKMWWDTKNDMPKIEVWRFNPSSNISHAMAGVEIDENNNFHLCWNGKQWICQIWNHKNWVTGNDKTKELAVTKARLLWAIEKDK